jgi:23S rRNA G2069 N7-methylase RlmK/C1962 C5-methylase RlmI
MRNLLQKVGSPKKVVDPDTRRVQFTLQEYTTTEQSVSCWIAINSEGLEIDRKFFLDREDFNKIRGAFRKPLRQKKIIF